MLIKFFRNGQGGGSGPVDYLVAREVVAYDENRNAIRNEHGEMTFLAREPLPEVLRGDAERMRALIDGCPHQWTYRAGVLAFTAEDAPTEVQQHQVMDAFEGLAFAGLDADQHDMLWVRHTHEGRVELHFLTPRMELASARSLNIAPPGYERHYDALRDVLNKENSWNDPQAPERARETVSLIESVRRGEARELIHDWIVERIEAGDIHDRTSMTAALRDAGFDLPRAGKGYLTVRDPETDERWRMKGELFREDWTRETTIERALERAAREPSRSGSRLDALSAGELRDRLERSLEARASYNRERYAGLRGREPAALERSPDSDRGRPQPASPDGAAVLPDHERLRAAGDLPQPDRELAVGIVADRPRTENQPFRDRPADQPDHDRPRPDLGRTPPAPDLLPIRQYENALPSDHSRAVSHAPNANNRTAELRQPLADGTRAAGLYREIDQRLGALDRAIRGAGEALDRHDRKAASGFGRLAEIAHRLAGFVHDRMASLRSALQRVGALRDRGSLRDAGAGRTVPVGACRAERVRSPLPSGRGRA